MEYTEEYYRNSNYSDYLEREERYQKLGRDIENFLYSINLDLSELSVLDFGCSVGFLVKYLTKHTDSILGYDISEWAINYGLSQGVKNLTTSYSDIISGEKFDILIALDVFEHMEIEDIKKMLEDVFPEYLLVRIPVPFKDGEDYVLDISNKDPTHITKLSKSSWDGVLEDSGYIKLVDLNLPTIWDSKGVLASLYRIM